MSEEGSLGPRRIRNKGGIIHSAGILGLIGPHCQDFRFPAKDAFLLRANYMQSMDDIVLAPAVLNYLRARKWQWESFNLYRNEVRTMYVCSVGKINHNC